MSTLGSRIRAARGKDSQEAFAKQLQISKGALGFYERDENLPNTDVILKICSATGVSLQWLMTGDGEMRSGDQEPQTLLPKSEVARRLIVARAQEVSAPEEAASTGGSALPAPSTLISCARCAKLEKRLEMAEEERRQASDNLVEALQANVALVTELGEQKVENIKLSQQVEAARQRLAEHSLKGPVLGDSAVSPSAPSAPSHVRPNK